MGLLSCVATAAVSHPVATTLLVAIVLELLFIFLLRIYIGFVGDVAPTIYLAPPLTMVVFSVPLAVALNLYDCLTKKRPNLIRRY